MAVAASYRHTVPQGARSKLTTCNRCSSPAMLADNRAAKDCRDLGIRIRAPIWEPVNGDALCLLWCL